MRNSIARLAHIGVTASHLFKGMDAVMPRLTWA